ncbi:hypothetical protein GH5_05085 [Leishmania sp. Ghana 2012 LV757]|uniref:hypothetical protein n=1 Tax=Leishmania sp. Ghana 2012 LV757 TaxID=2803181 RepID=UPI001B6814B6|nr:hypothetical protein GH5_05085 [Leishmania sp. Ghana 2012 LV757]
MLNITSIGTVVPSSAHQGTMLGKPIIYPDGYTIERAVFAPPQASAHVSKPVFTYKASLNTSAAPTKVEPYFTATICWVDGHPTFSITRSDNPAERTYTDFKSATTVWRKALEDAAKDFPIRQAELAAPTDSKSRLQVNGIRLYCLHLKEVHDELVSLPGGRGAFEAAAAASCAAPAPSAVAAVTAELDTRSTSLLSASGSQSQSQSQSQERTQRRRAISPMPKSSLKAPSAALSSARSSKQRATPSRRASVDKDASPSASTGCVGATAIIDNQALAGGLAVRSIKKRRTRQPKGIGEPADPFRPQRVSRNGKCQETAFPPAAAPAPAAFEVVCPDCGLSGAPFCATTGKLHLPPPCPTCGLTTAFCPVTGQPHAGAARRENRQRGEVHLPSATRRPRRRVAKQPPEAHAAAAGPDGEVAVVVTQGGGSSAAVVVGEGEESSKKTHRKRQRAEDERKQARGNGADVSGDGTTEKSARARRARKVKDGAVVAASPSETLAEGVEAVKGESVVAISTAEAVQATPVLVEEPAYTYPPLRPPLTLREHHKAAHLLQESWKAQYGDGPVLPAAVAAVPLALVPAKRVAAAGASLRRKGRGGAAGGGASGEEGKRSEDDEDGGEETGGAPAKGGDDSGDAGDRDTAKSGLSSAGGSPASTTAAALPVVTMVHPLEVTQLATSVAGKRLTRFLVQYTSERTLFDLLKSSSTTADSGAGRKTPRRPAQLALTGGDGGAAGAGDEGDCEAHVVAENDDGEHAVDAPGASPAEAKQGSVTGEAQGSEGGVLLE